MQVQDDVGNNVVDITARLERLRAVAMATNAAAARSELNGLAHALQYLDLVLKLHLQVGAAVENHDEIVDYLDGVKAQLGDYMNHFGLQPRQIPSPPAQ